MENALKRVGFVVLTLALTAGIYWLVFVDKAIRQDALEYSLNLLGKKLLAMVPDTADRKPVQMMYDQFVAQAKQQEIPPERIERVAANIMNLSNSETAITPQQAEAILRWSLAESLKVVRSGESTVVIAIPNAAPEAIIVPPPPPLPKAKPEDLKKAGERIKAMYAFNIAVQKAIEERQQQSGGPQPKIVYHVDDGLKIVVDPKIKYQLASPKHKQLYVTMQRMEKEKQLIWQENWQQEIEEQKERLQQQLEKLKELQKLQQLEQLQQLESLRSLESLQNLKILSSLPAIVIDSIQAGIRANRERLPKDSTAREK
ncbi:MAG: hypothetical protein ONB11_12700 [candidate division KSB1 bacterium]|nr:hypothetical protein [candidate division KSB1 bacterium]MDZ7340784.1 hypothetical protein [candidate division KSB1 bacterium]